MSNQKLYASDLFALSQGTQCHSNGFSKCHWCANPKCTSEFAHDDVPPIPFVRSKSTSLCPVEPYICYGCWLWRRERVTVRFLVDDFQDRQTAKNHSWWITEDNAYALRSQKDFDEVYRLLLKPPRKFILTLKEPGFDNLLQLCVANDPGGILGETPLYFTLNNIKHSFTVYEVTEAVKNGPAAYGPGVRALWQFLGEPPEDVKKKNPAPKDDVRKQGEKIMRDDPKKTVKKVVVTSGA